MTNNRDLLTEAIADAKAVKDTAIANAKLALEEAFTPYLKNQLSAKLEEMDKKDDEVKEAKDLVCEIRLFMKRNRNIIYSTSYKNVHDVLQLYVYGYLLKLHYWARTFRTKDLSYYLVNFCIVIFNHFFPMPLCPFYLFP